MKAKKSLGQNFLTSKDALDAIITAADLSSRDTVLEIGPGRGALTTALLASGAHVIAVEKDDGLFELLSKKFSSEIETKQLTLVHGDILETSLDQLIPPDISYKLVANIPYNITGEIIRMFLSGTRQPEKMVLLVQKEVAERIVAKDGKESILSMSVKVFGTPSLVAIVPAEAFSPQPNVDSAIISISNISRERFSSKEVEKRFFQLVKQGFSQKRKQLVSTLTPLASREEIISFLSAHGLQPTARAEELKVEDWLVIKKKENSES